MLSENSGRAGSALTLFEAVGIRGDRQDVGAVEADVPQVAVVHRPQGRETRPVSTPIPNAPAESSEGHRWMAEPGFFGSGLRILADDRQGIRQDVHDGTHSIETCFHG